METLRQIIEYVNEYAVRGDCTCGKCFDAEENPEQPHSHSVDMMFFKVGFAPDTIFTYTAPPYPPGYAQDLLDLIKEEPELCQILDGQEHGFIEIGAWMGSQEMALQLMGLGALLGMWKLLTPRNILPGMIPDDVAMSMAQTGLVTIRRTNDQEEG